MEWLLLFLFLHFLETDVLKNWINNRLALLWGSDFALGHGHHSLSNDVVDVNTDVLEHDVGDECVLGESFQGFNLFRLGSVIEIKFGLIRLASGIKLSYVLFERFDKEFLSFLAHNFNLAGDSLVHLLLSLSGVLTFNLFGDLPDLWFSSNLVMWLIYFLIHILSRIS